MPKVVWRSGIGAMALGAILGMEATPVDAGGAVTTSLFLPLVGTVFVSPGPCAENVPLSGMVHVVSIVPPSPISQSPGSPPIKLHFNMAGVLGTGETTGHPYVATGAARLDAVPPDPIAPQGFALSPNPPPVFELHGTGSCEAQFQLPVSFSLLFDSSGHLLPGSTANLGGQCSADIACN